MVGKPEDKIHAEQGRLHELLPNIYFLFFNNPH